jgi:hypothetical protein
MAITPDVVEAGFFLTGSGPPFFIYSCPLRVLQEEYKGRSATGRFFNILSGE